MVAPGFLQTPRVREWLNGIEPDWTLLDFDSFNALRHEPSRDSVRSGCPRVSAVIRHRPCPSMGRLGVAVFKRGHLI
jgi:hypothetical protein